MKNSSLIIYQESADYFECGNWMSRGRLQKKEIFLEIIDLFAKGKDTVYICVIKTTDLKET